MFPSVALVRELPLPNDLRPIVGRQIDLLRRRESASHQRLDFILAVQVNQPPTLGQPLQIVRGNRKRENAEIAEKTIVNVGFSANSVKALRSLRLKAT